MNVLIFSLVVLIILFATVFLAFCLRYFLGLEDNKDEEFVDAIEE